MFNRIAVFTLILLVAAFSAQAQPPGDEGGAGAAANPMTNSGIKLDQSPLLKAADTDKDGKLSMAEWEAVGGTENIFTHTDKDTDGFMTLAEMNDTSPPDMADADKDGKFTLDEFKAMISAGGGPPSGGGAPGGGAPPEGGGQQP